MDPDSHPRTLIVCGISGVGKTHQIRSVIEQLPDALTWSASEIIGEARQNTDPEYLRSLPEDELARSQEMLVRGYARRAGAVHNRVILLDAHSVLDTGTGMFDISTELMRCLYPLGFIHLEDQIESILERRTRDTKKKRPARTLDQSRIYHERSRATCREYEATLGKPMLGRRSVSGKKCWRRAYEATLGKPMLEARSGDTAGFLKAVHTLLVSKLIDPVTNTRTAVTR